MARHPTAHEDPSDRCFLPDLTELTGPALHRTRPEKIVDEMEGMCKEKRRLLSMKCRLYINLSPLF